MSRSRINLARLGSFPLSNVTVNEFARGFTLQKLTPSKPSTKYFKLLARSKERASS